MMRFYYRWKFTVLLAVILILNLTRMLTVGDFQDRFILDILGAAMLAMATISLCVSRKSRAVALLLGIPAILLSLSRSLVSEHLQYTVLVGGRVASLLFLTFIIIIILRTLLNQEKATVDHICGAFCGYILIGVLFAEAFCLLEVIAPHSYRWESVTLRGVDDALQKWLMLEYFSFTTLTTLGFGDVVPVSPMARGLAIWEVICGQFYLAVLVAGLVNLRGAQDATESDES